MGRLTMTKSEYNYMVDNIREAFDLIGQKAVLFEVDSEIKDIYRDADVIYKDGKEISLIFEDNPKPILKKFNWMTESDELPIVANIVALANDGTPIEVRENMKVLLMSELGLKTQRMFLVSRVTANSIDPLVFICKLVPYRYKVDVDVETEGYQPTLTEKNDVGFSYLKVNI